MRKVQLFVLFLFLATPMILPAQPAQNISHRRHPNLAAAQKLCSQAYERIEAAQTANEWDMEGHAQKAKDLLTQVNSELKAAALAANVNK